jgi:hypothetical protein
MSIVYYSTPISKDFDDIGIFICETPKQVPDFISNSPPALDLNDSFFPEIIQKSKEIQLQENMEQLSQDIKKMLIEVIRKGSSNPPNLEVQIENIIQGYNKSYAGSITKIFSLLKD